MTDKVTMKSVLDRAIGELREGFVDAKTVADITSQHQSLGHMDLHSSERVYPVTIGKAYDCDIVTVDKLEIRVSLRMVKPGDEPPSVWLDSGLLVSITPNYGPQYDFQPRFTVSIEVDDGPKFTRPIKTGERLWVTEAMLDKAFYPFVITRNPRNGNRLCRSPLNNLKQAIEHYTQFDTE